MKRLARSGILSNSAKIEVGLSSNSLVDISRFVRNWGFTLNRAQRRRATIGRGAIVRFLDHRTGTLRFTVDDGDQDVFDLFWLQSGKTLFVKLTETTDTVFRTPGTSGAATVYTFNGPMQVNCVQSSSGVHQFTVNVSADRTIS